MKAGRELDKLIAEKVFGHKVVKTVWGKQKQYSRYSLGEPDYYDDQGSMELFNPLPRYSDDIATAWEVVEKLKTDGWRVFILSSDLAGTDVDLTCNAGARGRVCSDLMGGEVTSAPHAICLAAIKAAEKN